MDVVLQQKNIQKLQLCPLVMQMVLDDLWVTEKEKWVLMDN